jgi:hypothetical protein
MVGQNESVWIQDIVAIVLLVCVQSGRCSSVYSNLGVKRFQFDFDFLFLCLCIDCLNVVLNCILVVVLKLCNVVECVHAPAF